MMSFLYTHETFCVCLEMERSPIFTEILIINNFISFNLTSEAIFISLFIFVYLTILQCLHFVPAQNLFASVVKYVIFQASRVVKLAVKT